MDKVGHKKLTVWHKADEFAFEVYITTRHFPKEELYGITSQLRRAVLSIPTNIVEGYGRHGKKELKHFLNIALGSLAEARYLLDFSSRLKYLSTEQHERLESLAQEVVSCCGNSISLYNNCDLCTCDLCTCALTYYYESR